VLPLSAVSQRRLLAIRRSRVILVRRKAAPRNAALRPHLHQQRASLSLFVPQTARRQKFAFSLTGIATALSVLSSADFTLRGAS
jgi:hypothetical protein